MVMPSKGTGSCFKGIERLAFQHGILSVLWSENGLFSSLLKKNFSETLVTGISKFLFTLFLKRIYFGSLTRPVYHIMEVSGNL